MQSIDPFASQTASHALCVANNATLRRQLWFIATLTRGKKPACVVHGSPSNPTQHWIPFVKATTPAETLVGMSLHCTLGSRGVQAMQTVLQDGTLVTLPAIQRPAEEIGVDDEVVEDHTRVAPDKQRHSTRFFVVSATGERVEGGYPYLALRCIPLEDFMVLLDGHRAELDAVSLENGRDVPHLVRVVAELYGRLRPGQELEMARMAIPLEDDREPTGPLATLVTLMRNGHLRCTLSAVKLPAVDEGGEPLNVGRLQRQVARPVPKSDAVKGFTQMLRWVAGTGCAADSAEDRFRQDLLNLVKNHQQFLLPTVKKSSLGHALVRHLPGAKAKVRDGKALQHVLDSAMADAMAVRPGEVDAGLPPPIRVVTEHPLLLEWLREDVMPCAGDLAAQYIRWVQTLDHLLRFVCKMRKTQPYDPSNFPAVVGLFQECMSASAWHGGDVATQGDFSLSKEFALYLASWEKTGYSRIYNGSTHRLVCMTCPIGNLAVLEKDPRYKETTDHTVVTMCDIHPDTILAVEALFARLTLEKREAAKQRTDALAQAAKERAEQQRQEFLARRAENPRQKRPKKHFDEVETAAAAAPRVPRASGSRAGKRAARTDEPVEPDPDLDSGDSVHRSDSEYRSDSGSSGA